MLGQHASLKAIIFILLCLLIAGCSGRPKLIVNPLDPNNPDPKDTTSPPPTAFQALTNTPSEIPPTLTPSSTFTPLPTDTPTPTDTPVPTSTPDVVFVSAGHVKVPILLYHHVSDKGNGNRYYVSVADFRAQMEALHGWGYTALTVSQLVDVLLNGGELPSRPVVITFDDGNEDVYENAYPIMRAIGYVGTNYIVANRLESKNFLNVEELQEMVDAGWEIGSHSITHSDLTKDHSIANYEIRQSMLILEEATGETVSTFAYPFGETDEFISTKVSEYGYRAGMGLGEATDHYLGTLFYLSRIEIHSDFDLAKFASLLPWTGP